MKKWLFFSVRLLLLLFYSSLIHAQHQESSIPTITKDGDHSNGMSKTITNDLVSTETVYTTITASATPIIYNASNTDSPAHQQQSQSASNVNDPNNNNGLEESLKSDQQALKRMIMILSLVGGLGVVAVVTTVVIFTRMRAKNKKNRECIDDDQHDSSTIALSLDNHDGDDSTPSATHASLSDQPPTIEPSAPPATILSEDTGRLYYDNRRRLVSMISQTTAIPSPSAPTAKELDAAVDDGPSIPSTSGHHRHHSACTRCLPEILPELPPPAYTPSAPPHYALPVEAVAMDHLLPSRRHSLGA